MKVNRSSRTTTVYTYTIHAPKGMIFDVNLSKDIIECVGDFKFGLSGRFITFESSMNYDGLTDDEIGNMLLPYLTKDD